MPTLHARRKQVKAEVRELVLELTRRCNMTCAHCLRGDAQSVDMTPELIEQTLAPIARIETLTFSGGEPSLVPHLMQKTLSVCKRKHIKVGQIYLATNGKEVSPAFIKACQDWHRYAFTCLSDYAPDTLVSQDKLKRDLSLLQSIDVLGCWVALSIDAYHDPIPSQNLYKLAALPHLVDDKHHEASQRNWVIPEGRAADNDIRAETMLDRRPWMFDDKSKLLEIETDDPNERIVEMVYINAKGQLLKYCDYSFASQKEQAILDLNELPDGQTWLDAVCAEQEIG